MKEIFIKSSYDETEQPFLYYPAREENRPLLVGLHTWSFDRFNQVERLVPFAEKLDFNLILPEFRGPNLETNPHCTEACGSPAAINDILDDIDYICKTEKIDTKNIFLLGASGGGHMALMTAAVRPELFACVASFVPITDVKRWAKENENYAPGIIACCGGDEQEMGKRSPISYTKQLAKANLKIFCGKYDHIVPFKHSLDLYNEILKADEKARVYLDIFDGGHEMVLSKAEEWIISQYKKQKSEIVTG